MLLPLIGCSLKCEPVQTQLHRRKAPCLEIKHSPLPFCLRQSFAQRRRSHKVELAAGTRRLQPRRAAIEVASHQAAAMVRPPVMSTVADRAEKSFGLRLNGISRVAA